MFARVTPYKMKAGTRDEATALLHSLKDQILALDGMRHFINVMKADGSGHVIALVDSEAAADGNAERVKEIWANFADHLEAVPVPETYDVIADWTV